MRRTRIKFCGMMSATDVALAVEAGADALGVIVAPSSPRKVDAVALASIAAAIPPFVCRIGVVTSPSDADAAALRALGFTLQFSGEESPEECERFAGGSPYVKAFHVGSDEAAPPQPKILDAYRNALVMFDSRAGEKLGGTGNAFSWDVVAPLVRTRTVVMSGGLTAENVGGCVRGLRPYAVDVRSGIESAGRKDAVKMRAFVDAVRRADAQAAQMLPAP